MGDLFSKMGNSIAQAGGADSAASANAMQWLNGVNTINSAIGGGGNTNQQALDNLKSSNNQWQQILGNMNSSNKKAKDKVDGTIFDVSTYTSPQALVELLKKSNQ